MRTRQVTTWMQTHCAHYATDCTVDRRADIQHMQEKILAAEMEVDVCNEEVRRYEESIRRLEASMRDIITRKKAWDDL